jgi:hypothetical protein
LARRAPRDGSEDRVARGVERFAGDDAEFAAAEEDVPRYEAGGPVDDAALGGAVEAEGDEGSKMVRADAPLELALACDIIFCADTAKLGQPEVNQPESEDILISVSEDDKVDLVGFRKIWFEIVAMDML